MHRQQQKQQKQHHRLSGKRGEGRERVALLIPLQGDTRGRGRVFVDTKVESSSYTLGCRVEAVLAHQPNKRSTEAFP